MRGRELQGLEGESDVLKSLMGHGSTVGQEKKKSKKEEQIDRKIESLLEAYKRQDEEILKRAHEKEANKHRNKQMLRDKFGFSDDEEEFNEEQEE